MDSVEFLQAVNILRKNKTFLSNAILTRPQLDIFLSEKNTKVVTDEELLILLTNHKDYYRLYFYALDEKALKRIKEVIPKLDKPIVIDVVGKLAQVESLSQKLNDCGFTNYSTFIRMTCNSVPNMDNVDCSEVCRAKKEDIGSILELLNSEFDPLFAHFPEQQALSDAIVKGEITVVRKQEKLAGLAYFEKTSATSRCLRYFVVNNDFRGQGIGNVLLANTFAYNPEITKYMLWVRTYNSAVNLYKKLNFVQDSILDYILVYRGE